MKKNMKKILELLIRIIITITICIIILFIIDRLIGIRREQKNKWTWTDETTANNHMLLRKYKDEKSDIYPIILNKDEDIEEKEPGEKRIFVVGDSYVWGYGVSNNNYLWWKQLQKKFKEEGYDKVTIYAAGYWGLNTEEELNLIINNDKIIKKVDPDLIIMGYITNDPEKHNKDGSNVVPAPENWEYNKDNPDKKLFLKAFYNIYKETRDRIYNITDNKTILKIVGKVYGYRYDIRNEIITTGDNLKYYSKVLEKLNNKMNTLEIPYFFYYFNNEDKEYLEKANTRVRNEMDKYNIKYYSHKEKMISYYQKMSTEYGLQYENFWVNPGDSHPGNVLTNYYSEDIFQILKDDYSYLFETEKTKFQEKLNINDTMPPLNIKKIDDNTYEFNYPKKEKKRNIDSNFLYYPINKNYIKLNFEYPVNISKVKIKGENIKNTDLYLNTFDENLGFDVESAFQRLTPTNQIEPGEFMLNPNQKITSLNISIDFITEKNRKIKIEIEK